MSDNKLKYFTVTTTTLVRANNKTHAEKIAMSNRRKVSGLPGEVIYKDVEVDRITAVEAREQFVD
jgi:hypothetical protein